MINNVVLVGRLTRDVDLRYTQSGTAVANFTVACDRNYRNAQGETQTDFISCVMWRKSAENFARFTRKGSLVGIEGTIQTRSYDNQQGQKVYVTEVLANNFSLLESKSVTEQRPSSNNNVIAGGTTNFDGNSHNQPFPNYDQQDSSPNKTNSFNGVADPFSTEDTKPFPSENLSDNNASINIADDDLPF